MAEPKLKTWSVRLNPEQRERADRAVTLCIQRNAEINVRREAVNNIMITYLKTLEDIIIEESPGVFKPDEIRFADEIEIQKICELGFLKKTIEIKTGVNKWHCLRGIYKTGKAKLAGDGIDLRSIREHCEACHKGYRLDEQSKRTHDTILAIQRFGDSEINVLVNACIHPDNEFIQLLLGDKGELICTLQKKRVDINKVCIETECTYLQSLKGAIQVKETEPYKDLERALEAPT